MAKKDKIVSSSGNVFTDLGFDENEAANLRIRAMLMATINQYINDHELTQADAAKLFNEKQPRISEIKQGKIELFTVDKLINMLACIDYQVDVTVREKAA